MSYLLTNRVQEYQLLPRASGLVGLRRGLKLSALSFHPLQ